MPYNSVKDLPEAVQRLPRKLKRQFMHVFNSVYERAVADGKSEKEAEQLAFASAWSVVNGSKKFFQDLDGNVAMGITRAELIAMAEKYPKDFSILGLTAPEIREALDEEMNKSDLPGAIRLLVPITKVDAEKRMVRGVATAEVMDSQGEVLSYDGTKEAVKSWVGNLREMHQPKAVGKRVEMEFDDVERTLTVTGYISKGAPDTWEKCMDGTLSMYSVGGDRVKSTVKRAADCPEHIFMGKTEKPEKVRWTDAWTMHELSLVDAGANPKASFALVKFENGELMATDILDNELVDKVEVQGEAEIPPPASEPPAGDLAEPSAASPGAALAEAAAKSASDGENKTPIIAQQASTPAASAPPEEQGTGDSEQGTEKIVEPLAGQAEEKPPELTDAAFAYAKDGVRKYQVKDAAGKVVDAVLFEALRTAERATGDEAEIARKAMPKIRAASRRLKMEAFKSDPQKFLASHDVFKIGYGYEDELESDAPLEPETVLAYVAEHGDAPVAIFKSKTRTFGEMHAHYMSHEPDRHFWDWLDMLRYVLGNILLDTDLAAEDRRKLVNQSFAEFLNVIMPVAEAAAEASAEHACQQIDVARAAAEETMTKEFENALLKSIDDLKALIAGQKAEHDKFAQDLKGRLERVEATPVIPAGAQLKVVKAEEKDGARKADAPQSLPDLQKRYNEIVAEIKTLPSGDARVSGLRLEGTTIAHEIERLKGNPVWEPLAR